MTETVSGLSDVYTC